MKGKLTSRLILFAVGVIKLGKELKKSYEGRHIYGQLFRSSSSVGANYEESHSAQSAKDFIHKREVCLKELRESLFWLKLIKKAGFIEDEATNIESLHKECYELINIVAKSVVTMKKKIIIKREKV